MQICRSLCLAAIVITLGGCNPTVNDAKSPENNAKPVRDVTPAATNDQQFVVSSDSPEALTSSKQFGVCPVESMVSLADSVSGSAASGNAFTVQRGKPYKIIGWAINKESSTVPGHIKIVLAGDKLYERAVSTGLSRPDVVDFFKTPGFGTAGYQIDARFDSVPPGTYRLFVLDTTKQPNLVCPTQQTLTVQ